MDQDRIRIRETTRVKKWESRPPDDPAGPDETIEVHRWFDGRWRPISDEDEIARLNQKLEAERGHTD